MNAPPEVARPEKTTTAVTLLYAALAIAVFRSIDNAFSLNGEAFWGSLTGAVMVQGATWFLIYMISWQRNWARVTFLVIGIVAIPLSLLAALLSSRATTLIRILALAQSTLLVIALVFLFQRASSAWFRNRQMMPAHHSEPQE